MGLAEVETEPVIVGQTYFEPAKLEVPMGIVRRKFFVAVLEQSARQQMSWTIPVLQKDLCCH